MKECKSCKVVLIVGENITKSAFNNSDFRCKPCIKSYHQTYYLENMDTIKKSNIKHTIKWNNSQKDGFHSVYLLPKHNYVGITENLYIRMGKHKNGGRDTTDYRVLYKTKDRELGLELEELLHDMGYEGKHANKTN